MLAAAVQAVGSSHDATLRVTLTRALSHSNVSFKRSAIGTTLIKHVDRVLTDTVE